MCQADEFKCGTGVCVPLSWQCDGEKDCGDGLDEWEELCSKYSLVKTLTSRQIFIAEDRGCKDNEFSCAEDGLCIPEAWRCDHHRDCDSGADEINCSEFIETNFLKNKLFQSDMTCGKNEYQCKDQKKCIEARYFFLTNQYFE